MKITFEHVYKRFPGRTDKKKEVIAANDINLEIPDGRLICLLGPSGCGKSTTLNLVSGLEEVSEGRIYFDEEDVTDYPPEIRGIGMVFQNYALYPHLTVKQNIVFPLENLKGDKKLSKEEMNKRAYEVAKLVQIEELMDRKPAELSGGQQQRVAIARALVKTPRVLLLDEPLSNLDARLRLSTREEIRRIQKETKVTTIFVTHDQEEAMSISDLIILMNNGYVVQVGNPQEVYDNPCNIFTARFLGTPSINMFNGNVKDKKMYIGEDYIMNKDIDDQEVYVGIRPEAMTPNKKGSFVCGLDRYVTMGREHSLVCHNANSIYDEDIHVIINSDIKLSDDKEIRFSLDDNKVFVFSKEDERRI